MSNNPNGLVKLTKETIDEIFLVYQDQGEAVIALYRHVYPEWDDIELVGGYPKVSYATNEYIFGKFFELVGTHLNVWFNSGFSCLDNRVPDWMVERAPFTLKG